MRNAMLRKYMFTKTAPQPTGVWSNYFNSWKNEVQNTVQQSLAYKIPISYFI